MNLKCLFGHLWSEPKLSDCRYYERCKRCNKIKWFNYDSHDWDKWYTWGITYQQRNCKNCGRKQVKDHL